MKRIIFLTAILSVSITLFSGCQDTVNSMQNTPSSMKLEPVNASCYSTDDFCRDRLKILGMNKSVTPGGSMQIQVVIRSERYGFWSELWSGIMGDNPYYVNYKFDWLDQNGMKVNTANSAWMTAIFIPGETKFISSVAPSDKCKDFLLQLKEADSK